MPFQSVNVLPVLPKPHNGLPRGPQLSAPEDKEMKKKLRNRESALAARERKKKKMLGNIYRHNTKPHKLPTPQFGHKQQMFHWNCTTFFVTRNTHDRHNTARNRKNKKTSKIIEIFTLMYMQDKQLMTLDFYAAVF